MSTIKKKKISVDRKRSCYGEKFNLRFHKPIQTYHLSCSDCTPMLLAKFTEVDGDLAMHCWETFEKLYQKNTRLEAEVESLKRDISELNMELCVHVRRYNELKERIHKQNEIKYGKDSEWCEIMNRLMESNYNGG